MVGITGGAGADAGADGVAGSAAPELALALALMVLLARAATSAVPARTSPYTSVLSAAKVLTAAFSWALRTATSHEGSAGRPISYTRARMARTAAVYTEFLAVMARRSTVP